MELALIKATQWILSTATYVSMNHFNIILQYAPRPPCGPFFRGLQPKILYVFLIHPTQFIRLDIIIILLLLLLCYVKLRITRIRKKFKEVQEGAKLHT